jgi:hypothetical protein
MPALAPQKKPEPGVKHPLPGDLPVPRDEFGRILTHLGVLFGLAALALALAPEAYGNRPLALGLAMAGAGLSVPGLGTRRRWVFDAGLGTLEMELKLGPVHRTVVVAELGDLVVVTTQGLPGKRTSDGATWSYQAVAVTGSGKVIPLAPLREDVYRATDDGRSIASTLRVRYEIGQFEKYLKIVVEDGVVAFSHVEEAPKSIRTGLVRLLALLAVLALLGLWATGQVCLRTAPPP